MLRKITKIPKNILIYLTLNVVSIVNLLIILQSPNNYNNFLIHFIYNITSIFVIIPANLIEFSMGVLYRPLPVFNTSVFVTGVLLLSFVFNFFITKLILSRIAQNLYEKYLQPHPLATKIGVIVILLLFAFD